MITSADARSIEATEMRAAGDAEIGGSRARERDLAILLAEVDVKESGAQLPNPNPGLIASIEVTRKAALKRLLWRSLFARTNA